MEKGPRKKTSELRGLQMRSEAGKEAPGRWPWPLSLKLKFVLLPLLRFASISKL